MCRWSTYWPLTGGLLREGLRACLPCTHRPRSGSRKARTGGSLSPPCNPRTHRPSARPPVADVCSRCTSSDPKPRTQQPQPPPQVPSTKVREFHGEGTDTRVACTPSRLRYLRRPSSEGPAAQCRSQVSSSGAGEPPRKRRLPHCARPLTDRPAIEQGTPCCQQWQDHSAISMPEWLLYAADTNSFGKEVPRTYD